MDKVIIGYFERALNATKWKLNQQQIQGIRK